MKVAIDHVSIKERILDAYLRTGKPPLISIIANDLGTSPAKVHATIEAAWGDLETTEEEVVAGKMGNYTGRYRMAPAVQPSRRWLIRLLNAKGA